MQHLKYLATAYRIMMMISVLGALAVFGVGAWVDGQPDVEEWAAPLVVAAGGMSLVIGGLFFVAASKVTRGEGRTLATALAVLQMGNCPGILVAGYTIWVCWMNAETKAVFDAGGLSGSPTVAPARGPLGGSTRDPNDALIGGSTRKTDDGPFGGAV